MHILALAAAWQRHKCILYRYQMKENYLLLAMAHAERMEEYCFVRGRCGRKHAERDVYRV